MPHLIPTAVDLIHLETWAIAVMLVALLLLLFLFCVDQMVRYGYRRYRPEPLHKSSSQEPIVLIRLTSRSFSEPASKGFEKHLKAQLLQEEIDECQANGWKVH